MIRTLMISATLALSFGGAALAAPDLTPAFKGTIVSTYPSGRSTKLWLNPDGTYTAQRTHGGRTSGVWKFKGDRVCLTQKQPASFPFSFCNAIPAVGAGQTWQSKSPKGEPLNNRLEPTR